MGVKVKDLPVGEAFYWAGKEMIKVRPAFNEKLVLEVDADDFGTFPVDSEDNAAVDLNSGFLYFVTDEVYLVSDPTALEYN